MSQVWQECRLGDVSDIRYGYTAKASTDIAEPKFLRITDIQNAAVNWSAVPGCPITSEDFEKHRLQEGDIVFARTGATTGKSYRIIDAPEAVAASYLIRVRITEKDLTSAFLELFFKSADYWTQVKTGIIGSAQGGFNASKLAELKILIPPPEEQKRIVALLDEAFAGIETAIANTEKNLANARELGETSLERIISRFDTTEKVLADVVAEDCSLSYGIVQPGRECDEGLPVVRPVDLTQPTITSNGLKRIDPEKAASYLRTKLQGGELLLCVRGTTGTVAQASEELAGGNVTRGIVPIRYSSEFVDQAFGYYLLRSAHVQAQIREKTYGAALMQINIRDLRKIKLNVPPVEQQKEMVVTLRRVEADLSSLRSHYQHKLNSLNELKQSLLQKAFSGELTADRAQEELESATA